MPRLTRPGAAAHGLLSLLLVGGMLLAQPQAEYWPGLPLWLKATLLLHQGVTALLFAAAALTRHPLIGEAGPLRHGWLVMIGMMAAWFVLTLAVDDSMLPFWPVSAATLFVPLMVFRLEEAYEQGRQEGQAEVDARRAD